MIVTHDMRCRLLRISKTPPLLVLTDLASGYRRSHCAPPEALRDVDDCMVLAQNWEPFLEAEKSARSSSRSGRGARTAEHARPDIAVPPRVQVAAQPVRPPVPGSPDAANASADAAAAAAVATSALLVAESSAAQPAASQGPAAALLPNTLLLAPDTYAPAAFPPSGPASAGTSLQADATTAALGCAPVAHHARPALSQLQPLLSPLRRPLLRSRLRRLQAHRLWSQPQSRSPPPLRAPQLLCCPTRCLHSCLTRMPQHRSRGRRLQSTCQICCRRRWRGLHPQALLLASPIQCKP
jgi:hypothetical protein